MKDLIEALQVFIKYVDLDYPTNCTHDLLFVDCKPEMVSEEDIKKLDELGFFIMEDDHGFGSFRFGSC